MSETNTREDEDAALVVAVQRMARSLTKGQHQFDYRDLAQDTLAYVLGHDGYLDAEHRAKNATLKCRNLLKDTAAVARRSVSLAPDQLAEADDARSKPMAFGLYPQELRVYATEVAYRRPMAVASDDDVAPWRFESYVERARYMRLFRDWRLS